MKKLLSLVLIICFFVSMLPAIAVNANESGEVRSSGVYDYVVVNGAAEIVKCDENVEGDIEIPQYIDGLPVTSIGKQSFSDCGDLDSVTIPEGVTHIGEQAFYPLFGIKKIKIADSVEEIGDMAFGEIGIKTLKLPKNLKVIGYGAFLNCYGIEGEVILPDGLEVIGGEAFQNCKNVTNFVIPESVTRIDAGAFKECKGLSKITIPGNVETLDRTFYLCRNLEEIHLPLSIKKIDIFTFDECPLKDVYYEGTEDQWKRVSANFAGVDTEYTIHFKGATGIYDPVTKLDWNGHTYHFYDESITWEEAKRYCENSGGYLATFTSEEEWNAVQEKIKENRKNYWLGGYSKQNINRWKWKWVTGEEWVYSAWNTGEPDNDYGKDNGYLGTNTSSYKWNDYKPDTEMGFICEWGPMVNESVPYEDGWAIANSGECFGYGENGKPDYIEKDIYRDVFGYSGDLLYYNDKKAGWGGNCFGMTVLSAMQHNGQIDLGKYFDNKNDSLCEYSYDTITFGNNQIFKLTNKDVISVIERSQVSQDSTIYSFIDVPLRDIVKHFKNSGAPLVAALSGAGHAILITDLKHEEAPWYGFSVYDPNFPMLNSTRIFDDSSWFYNQEIARNRMFWYNADSGEWQYQTYNGSDKSYTYCGSGATVVDDLFVLNLFDVSELDSKFIQGKLEVSDKTKVYIYPNSGPVNILDKESKAIIEIEKNIVKGARIKFYPIVGGEKNDNAPLGYFELDNDIISVEADNARIRIHANDDSVYVSGNGKYKAEIDTNKNSVNVVSKDDQTLNVICGMATETESTIVDVLGDSKSGENFGVSLDKTNNISISGNTTQDFKVTVENSNLENSVTMTMSSAELRNITSVSDIIGVEVSTKPDDKGSSTSPNFKTSGWAKTEVEKAYNEGLIPEALMGQDLTQKIDRAEFAAIAVRLYENLSGKKAVAGDNPFNDISGNAYENDILKAYNLGVTLGMGSDNFSPDTNITREQMAMMLTRAYKKSKFEGWTIFTDSKYPLDVSGVVIFEDDKQISNYAKEAVYFMAGKSIINGVGNNYFAPKRDVSKDESYGYATREQAIIIAIRSAEKLG